MRLLFIDAVNEGGHRGGALGYRVSDGRGRGCDDRGDGAGREVVGRVGEGFDGLGGGVGWGRGGDGGTAGTSVGNGGAKLMGMRGGIVGYRFSSEFDRVSTGIPFSFNFFVS
jgi:hypothetical protein